MIVPVMKGGTYKERDGEYIQKIPVNITVKKVF